MSIVLHAAFALGGGLGAVSRHALSQALPHRWPLATLTVNVLGSLLLGAVLALSSTVPGATDTPEPALQRLVIGFCGGFTTFSSFAVQSLSLYRGHSAMHLVINVGVNLAACLAALWLGGELVRA